ncbi:torsin-1A-interacting protein 2-like isoform X2 [Morone saxatilis]|uniref:torsin-1A-interacting protein 2-like isoform X2 n=1 Tax=Morone saxatilis TaxID=34816 RepID=UPI0015E1E6A5|nr:torsin-1A-interacting protein 2-like isoform X2 [Morone saxatilis]
MTEHNPRDQHTAVFTFLSGAKAEEMESTNMDHVSASDESKQEQTDRDQDVKQQHSEDSASSSASTNRETKSNNGEDVELAESKNGDSAEEKAAPLTDGSSSPDEASTEEDNSTSPQTNDGHHGDYNRETVTNRQPTMIGVTEKETQSANMDHVSASDENKQKETDITPIVKQQLSEDSASSSASTNRETKSNNAEEVGLAEVKKGSSSPDKASTRTEENNSTPPPTDEASHGDYNRETARNKQRTVIGEYHAGEKKAPEAPTPPTLRDRKKDKVDGPNDRLKTETPDTNTTKDGGSDLEIHTVGPTTQESTEHADPVVTGITGGCARYLIAVVIVVVVAILVQHLFQPEAPPEKKDVRQIDIFLSQMDKLNTQFPNQRAELWKRSRIHLLRHLQTAQPTEPVSLILTAGVNAQRTLRCLAQGLASAFSSALNASVLHIDGAGKASQDSDQVKLDIDSKLQGAFEGDKPVAVIHRFEELPPGSTLIFYRYCDHENAAYKKTCLIFTVLLEEEEEIPAKSRLSTVEEMVDDHLQKKFLSDGHPVAFDRMDLDKYGGLWSRISHLILPVAAEERMEHEGC